MKKRKVTLYVQSVKTVTEAERRGRMRLAGGPGIRGGYRVLPGYEVYSEVTYENILSDDQEKVVEIVKEIAHKHGFEVKVVDVANENILDKISKMGLKIKTFPTLITDSGEKIEGDITKERMELLLTRVA